MSMENDKLQICVIEPANGGGLVHFAYQLCTALTNEGADVTLIVGTEYELDAMPHNFKVEKMLHLWKGYEKRSEQDLTNRFRHLQKRIFWAARRVVRGIRFLIAWLNLAAYLLRTKPHLVQFSRFDHFLDAIFITFLKSRGFILSQVCHEFESREGGGGLRRLLVGMYRRAYRSFSAIFLLAHEGHDRFLSLFPSVQPQNVFVIPHGNSEWLLNIQSSTGTLKLRQRYGLREDEKVVLFFGLLAPSKGLEDLAEAFALALETCDARLLIAGYPTKQFDLLKLNARITEMGIGDKVTMDLRYIPLEEVGALMNLATVVVYPYHSSTQSGSLQVAYTFGKPVIATAVGGLPEAVEDGRSGFLVPPQSPRLMAEKISLLVNDPLLAQELGRYARHLSDTRFAWDTIARQMLAIYKTL
jgi:glycosyltransferase involved in cell wall biosynthesis